MSTSRIRGWAGVALAALGLLLWRAGPGFAVSASASPGCRDGDACRAVRSLEGTVTSNGVPVVTSNTARCEGECNGLGTCVEISSTNGDGSRTFQCSCDPNSSPAGCSGFVTVESRTEGDQVTEECTSFECIGACDPEIPPSGPQPECRPVLHEKKVIEDCPRKTTAIFRCECRKD